MADTQTGSTALPGTYRAGSRGDNGRQGTKPSSTPRRPRGMSFTAMAVVALALAACSPSHPSAGVAERIGLYMSNVTAPVTVRSAVWRALNGPEAVNYRPWLSRDTSESKVDVLQADGTLWNGELVLRITADTPTDTLVNCYRLDFRHTMNDATPHAVRCPGTATITLTSPAGPTVDDTVRNRLVGLLNAIPPPQRATGETVRTTLTHAFPALAVSADRRTDGSWQLAITNYPVGATSCLFAKLPPSGPAQVGPVNTGLACRGG
jgi:hypothetical protein